MTQTTEQALAQQKADHEKPAAVPAVSGSTALATGDDDARIATYLNEHAGGGGAIHFRFKDGAYHRVTDDEVIPAGTEFIAVFDKVQTGWIKFHGKGEQPTRKMGPLFGGFVMPPREALGDQDPSLWEMGLDGKPQDPWQSQIMLPLLGKADDELYIFSTTTRTGRNACGRLISLCQRMAKREPGMYPIVRLDVSGYEHRDARVGWVKTPQFTRIGATPVDGTKSIDTSISADLNDEICI